MRDATGVFTMWMARDFLRGYLVLRLGGELDLHTAADFRRLAEKELDETGARGLVLNLTGLTFIDSSGLGAILGRYKRVSAAGGTMALVGPRPSVRRILELSGIPRVMSIHASEEDAVKAAAAAGAKEV